MFFIFEYEFGNGDHVIVTWIQIVIFSSSYNSSFWGNTKNKNKSKTSLVHECRKVRDRLDLVFIVNGMLPGIKPKKINIFKSHKFSEKSVFRMLSKNLVIFILIFLLNFKLINELNNRFSNESSVIFPGISALCFGVHRFLLIKDLKDYAAAYSLNTGDLQHEILLVKKLQKKQANPRNSIIKFLSFLCSSKSSFDCLYNLLLISVTLLVTSVAERISNYFLVQEYFDCFGPELISSTNENISFHSAWVTSLGNYKKAR